MATSFNVTPPMVVLRPGDKVLITLEGEPPAADVQEITLTLREAFPGVEFVVLDGVQGICVSGGRT